MSLMMLEQMTVEDKYSRANIREKVLYDLLDSMGNIFAEPMQVAMGSVKDYMTDKYYDSKKVRIEHLRALGMSYRELILETLIIVMSVEGVQPIQAAAGKLATVLDYDDVFDGIKTAAELITVISDSDIYDVIAAKESETGSLMIKARYTLEESTLQYISNTKYLPPMICEPKEIKSNFTSGYLTKEASVILGKGNHHLKKQALDVLNSAASIALSIDVDMLKFEEKANYDLDTPVKIANHRRLVTSSKIVYKELIEQGNKFYFDWRFDKRGRMYSQGYHVNIQSTEFKKSIINLHTKHLIEGI